MTHHSDDNELVLTPDLVETVTEDLEAIAQLVFDADECDVLCGGVTDRLEELWGELQASSDMDVSIHHRAVPRLRDAIARCKDYITHHSGKKLLQRLVASRSAAESARLFHEEIDAFYRLLGIDDPPTWEDQWEEDRAEQQTQIGELVDNAYQDLGADLTPKLLTEVLYNLQYELARPHPEAHAARLAKTLGLVVAARKSDAGDPLPSWYIPSYDVLCSEALDCGSFGDVHRGSWAGARVVVKQLFDIDDDTRRAFARETAVWAPLAHPNVVRFFGACHVSEKLFFVSEDATGGNFRDYFRGTKRGFWRLFFQVACGLQYLHAHAIVHGDLKCNNLLVGADGAAKICDFGYSFMRLRSVGLSPVALTQAAAWKAPECIGGEGSAFKPRRESDVYALAMCIIEATTGEAPWCDDMVLDSSEEGVLDSSEEGVRDRLKANGGYPRPDGVFTDEQWALVEAMSRAEYTTRISLDEAIMRLKQLAMAEQLTATPDQLTTNEEVASRMEDPSQDIDAWVLPGAPLTVAEALERVKKLTREMRESEPLVKRLAARLQFLRSALKKLSTMDLNERSKLVARFGTTIGKVLRFLKKFSKKKALQRIAASRLVREGVRRLHSTIDIVFQDVGLSDAPEMNEWKVHEAADVEEQRERLEEIVKATGAVVRDLSNAEVEEALLEIRLEIEHHNNPEDFVALLKRAFTDPEATAGVNMWELEDWFVRRDDIEMAETPFDMGSFGVVFTAKRGAEGEEVCVKLLLVDGPDAQADFLKEARIWHKLSHPNVLKLFGGCHVGSPLFFVSELASAGNFVDYLYKSGNKGRLWELFRQVAQGLAFFHSQEVVHGNLKCTNLLVGDDGLAKLSGFRFSFNKTLSTSKSRMIQPISARWKAPECLLEQGPAGNPTFASDVFSLGMSIIEAKTGNVPWGMKSDDDIIDATFDSDCYPRPGGVFTDREWELVKGMTSFDLAKRWSLERVVVAMTELAAKRMGDAVDAAADSRISATLDTDTLSRALGVSEGSQDAAITAIKSSMEQMCLEKRENGQVLGLLVDALIRAARSTTNGDRQLSEATFSLLDEVYRQLLGVLKQHAFSTNIFCRIASNRHFLSEVEALRQQLITLGRLVQTTDSNELSDWSRSWDACLAIRDAQLHSQLEDARVLSEILPDQSAREEALMLLQFEMNQSGATSALVSAAFKKVMMWCGSDEDVSVPVWFIPGYEVQYDEAMLEGDGTFASVYVGVWRSDRRGKSGEKAVAVKVLLMRGLGGNYSHRSFVRSLDVWYKYQAHRNVLKLHGGSHVGQRAFLVLENADQGNLLKFIRTHAMKGVDRWRLLLQVANGLGYLHENKVVHGHLRCANILVSEAGEVKIADFGFDGVRTAMHALGHPETPRTLPWTAPELVLSSDGTPSFESDVYSFGMSIVEAVTGEFPWGAATDDEIVDVIFDDGCYPRPDGIFTDPEWELIEGMTAFDPAERWSLDRALEAMNALKEPDDGSLATSMTPEGTVHDENPALVHQLHEHDHGELNVKNEYMESSSDGETIKSLDQPTTTQKPVMPTQDQFQDIYSPPSSHATPPSKPNSVEMATIYKNASAKSSFDDGQIKGFNEEEVERGASASGSGPLHRGDRVVFSLVLADSTEDWNARFLLGLHEPIRHALFAIDCFFARIQPRSSPAEWNGIEFFTWFKASFTEFVKNQHEVKTAVIQPLVLLKVSAKSDIQNGYNQIYEMFDVICAQQDRVVFATTSASASWEANLSVLLSDIQKLNLLVNSILSAEEEALSPTLGKTFTARTFQQYVMPRIHRALKPKRIVIPWIMWRCSIWGGDAAAQAYKDALPSTARFLYERMWVPYFVRHVAPTMKHLEMGTTGTMVAKSSLNAAKESTHARTTTKQAMEIV